jgi:4-deoxy-L-threo-5-hexosulose-uronate ketol-isomerase
MYEPGELRLCYLDLDRAVAGMAAPLADPLPLPTYPQLRASYFTERRELGVLNIGGSGSVSVEGQSYNLANLDMLYVGRGNAEVAFASKDAKNPAVYYLLSYPAHTSYPVALIRKEQAQSAELGSAESCNRRTICRYIHLAGAQSCQLVMGVTHLSPGSSWNTMPPHTHNRRSEVYMYFNLAANARVVHLMGPTRRSQSRRAGRSMPAWEPPPTVFAGAWAARTRTTPTWMRRLSSICGNALLFHVWAPQVSLLKPGIDPGWKGSCIEDSHENNGAAGDGIASRGTQRRQGNGFFRA